MNHFKMFFDEYPRYITNVSSKASETITASSSSDLHYYRDLCSNLKKDNRKLIERINSLSKELEKKTQEYDELLEEVREC